MENSFEPEYNKWYDKKIVVGLLIFIFFPIGLYALWKSRTISKGWKVGWSLIIAIVALSVMGDENDGLNVNTEPVQQVALNSLDQDSLKYYLTNKYDVDRSWVEDIERNGEEQLEYTIIGNNWVLTTERTLDGKLSRIVCSGTDWANNRQLREVCNTVSDVVDTTITDFANSNFRSLISGESIPTYMEFYRPNEKNIARTILLGNYANFIIEFNE